MTPATHVIIAKFFHSLFVYFSTGVKKIAKGFIKNTQSCSPPKISGVDTRIKNKLKVPAPKKTNLKTRQFKPNNYLKINFEVNLNAIHSDMIVLLTTFHIGLS